jgi:hypothetical protein
MGRPIFLIASTLLFGLCGLLIGHLSLRVSIEMWGKQRFGSDDTFISYGVAPVVGAIAGFTLAFVALRLFGSKRNESQR